MSVKEHKVKNAVGKKCPLKTVALAARRLTEWLKMKVSQITLRWAGLKVLNGCKKPAIVHVRVRDGVEKKM